MLQLLPVLAEWGEQAPLHIQAATWPLAAVESDENDKQCLACLSTHLMSARG